MWETEAEAVAFVVCQAIGLATHDASSDYISLYLGDKETLLHSLSRIQRAATRIIQGVIPVGKRSEVSEPLVRCRQEARHG